MTLSEQDYTLSSGNKFRCWMVSIENCDGNKELWLRGSDIASLLHYKNTKSTIFKHVNDKHKSKWEDLRSQVKDHVIIPVNWQPHTIFISIVGFVLLVGRTKNEEAKKFMERLILHIFPKFQDIPNHLCNKQKVTNELEIFPLIQRGMEMEKKVAVITDDDETKYMFQVFKNITERDSKRKYKVIRCQNRNRTRALKSINTNKYISIFYKKNVPNAVSVLNKSKEILRNRNVKFKAYYNKIITTEGLLFEQIIESLLMDENHFSRLDNIFPVRE